jgi:transcriptional regulator GlxA family with amidase domain
MRSSPSAACSGDASSRDAAAAERARGRRRVGVLLFDGFSNLCLANAVEPLRAANTLADRPLYAWRFLTLDGAPATSSSGLPVTPAGALAAEPGGDLLLALPSYGCRALARPAALRALRAAAGRFGAVAGLDTGAWLMAAAGLLDGRRATIHWDEHAAFAEAFPQVRARPERMTIDGDRLTCGGAATAFELALALIQAHHGAALRLEVAAFFMHGEWRGAGEPGVRPTGEVRLDAAVALMRRHVEAPLPLPRLAREAGLSQRALEALFRRRLGLTPQAAYRRMRLAEARRLLLATERSVAEIAARCGWRDPGAMARAFREVFGRSPTALRAEAGGGGSV